MGYQKAYYAANRERMLAATKRWKKANPEKVKASKKRWRQAHPRGMALATAAGPEAGEKRRLQNRASLLSRHGLTRQTYETMAEAQKHLCLICDAESWVERSGLLHVDHDHATGRVRGLLCSRCNTGLGHFRDSIDFLKNAVRYLERSQSDTAV